MRIIAGEWGGRRIQAPRGEGTRPTTDRVREAWMSALHPRLPGARVLDLFAGSGALGLECLSRGAREAVFVEEARGALATLRANVTALGAGGRARIVPAEAHRWIEELDAGAFDLALADPPYAGGHALRLLDQWLRTPFAGELWIEHRTGEALPLPGEEPEPGTLPVRVRQRRYGDTTLTTLLRETDP